jgi:hypothetical protein
MLACQDTFFCIQKTVGKILCTCVVQVHWLVKISVKMFSEAMDKRIFFLQQKRRKKIQDTREDVLKSGAASSSRQ